MAEQGRKSERSVAPQRLQAARREESPHPSGAWKLSGKDAEASLKDWWEEEGSRPEREVDWSSGTKPEHRVDWAAHWAESEAAEATGDQRLRDPVDTGKAASSSTSRPVITPEQIETILMVARSY